MLGKIPEWLHAKLNAEIIKKIICVFEQISRYEYVINTILILLYLVGLAIEFHVFIIYISST